MPDAAKDGDAEAGGPRQRAPTMESGLGWLGWLLVAVIGLVLLVVPAVLLLLPESPGALEWTGLGLRGAYLVIPLVAAMLFGLVAVWAAVRARRM
jgi:hypothetical protein